MVSASKIVALTPPSPPHTQILAPRTCSFVGGVGGGGAGVNILAA